MSHPSKQYPETIVGLFSYTICPLLHLPVKLGQYDFINQIHNITLAFVAGRKQSRYILLCIFFV